MYLSDLTSLVIPQRGRTAAFYRKNKNHEDLDRSNLVVVPEAPRIAEQGFPSSFDWKFLPAKFYAESPLKPAHSDFNLSSNTNGNGMKASSSAFEILSASSGNLIEDEPEPEVKDEVVVTKRSAKKVNRPKTFK